jgi:hypothetical protein
MSLQYIIDAYNIINNPQFRPVSKSVLNVQQALADFIRFNKLAGSKNNKVILVFDGYPPVGQGVPEEEGLVCLFSRKIEADELIKKIVEESAQPKNIIVVSDDKEVRLMSRFLHAQVCGVDEFICGKKGGKFVLAGESDAADFKLSYSKMQKINAELKKKWLE